MVRSTPTPASSIIVAAAMPVSSETCAFHSSAATGGRNSRVKPPPSRAVTCCSGIGRLAPPRARSWAMRRSPISWSIRNRSSSVPASIAACTWA